MPDENDSLAEEQGGEPDEVAFEVPLALRRDPSDPTDREEVISAEEAAMHLTEEPPMDDDGYLED